ncbi:MAG: hypothetical protein ACP59X_20970 [Solidesulfovibrio sp. DCME]|uniref:hypothetical protein n=1 Tax=Solidesulfovibrio sp. DCME TaxID=3447380 RepID=UPI003D0AFDE7
MARRDPKKNAVKPVVTEGNTLGNRDLTGDGSKNTKKKERLGKKKKGLAVTKKNENYVNDQAVIVARAVVGGDRRRRAVREACRDSAVVQFGAPAQAPGQAV